MNHLNVRISAIVIGLLLVVLQFSLPARAQLLEQLAPDALVAALQKEGYLILLRHPETNPNQADTDPLNLNNTTAQRQLTDRGRAQAKSMGQALRDLKIPVGTVRTSMFIRAVEAAKLAGFDGAVSSPDFTEGGLVVTTVENQRRASALKKALATPPESGKNNIIISHRPNLLDAIGKDVFDVSEGEAIVAQPQAGDSFKLVGRVRIDAWTVMASGKK